MTSTTAHPRIGTRPQDVPTPHGTAPAGQHSWQVLDEVAAVRFLPSGLPLALRWRGGLWQVIGEPVSWSTTSTSKRSEPGTTPPAGQGGQDHLATRFWRFQAQTGPASPVLEFEMNADPRRDAWRLRRVAGVDGF